MMSSPARSPSRACAANEFTSSQASGAPSAPCLGASLRFLIVDRTTPIGRSLPFRPAFTRARAVRGFFLNAIAKILLRPDHYLPLHIYIIAIAMPPLSRRHFLQGMSSLLALPLTRTQEPEIILYNGNIWTEDPAQPRAQAVAISGARFLAVGTNAEVLPLATSHTRKIDLAFKTVLPGFNDAHSHPAESGVEHLRKVACDKDSIEKIQGALHERALQTPPGQWVLGFLYDDGKTPRPINRHDLDAAA